MVLVTTLLKTITGNGFNFILTVLGKVLGNNTESHSVRQLLSIRLLHYPLYQIFQLTEVAELANGDYLCRNWNFS